MYCRFELNDTHFNPFTEDCCSIFKIENNKPKVKNTAKKVKMRKQANLSIKLMVLTIWIIAGVPMSFIMPPYIAFKTAKTRAVTKMRREIGFLNASKIKKDPDELNKAVAAFVIIITVFTLPVISPLIFLGVLSYLVIIVIIAAKH